MRGISIVLAGALLGALAGCGSTRTAGPIPITTAGQLHQPGPPVVRAHKHVLSTAGDGIVQAAGARCGKERWNVKTATDPEAGQIVLKPQKTTVAQLGAFVSQNNGNPDQGRTEDEHQVYEVTAELVEAKRESDSDFHLVLREGAATMIAEIPNAPACTGPPITERVSVLEQQIESARTAFVQEFGEPQGYPQPGLAIHHQVTLTGVLFFDVPHGQTGVAPNAVELHPTLSIQDP